MAEAEKDRLKKQKENLGEDGLKEKEEQLKNANKENEVTFYFFCLFLALFLAES